MIQHHGKPIMIAFNELENISYLVSGTKSDIYTAYWNGIEVIIKVSKFTTIFGWHISINIF